MGLRDKIGKGYELDISINVLMEGIVKYGDRLLREVMD